MHSAATCRLARLKAGVPLSPAQGVPGLVDAVPVTSPPVAADSGSRSGAGSPQQAERTRAEERLRVPAGGNTGAPQRQWGHRRVAAPSGVSTQSIQVPFLCPQALAPKEKKGRKANVA